MFENIVIRASDSSDGPIDPGLIAETMLFYQNVHLLLDLSSLTHLLRKIGPECLLRLISEHGVKITYLEDRLMVPTIFSSGIPIYNIYCMSVARNTADGPLKGKKEKILFAFEKSLGKTRENIRFAKRLSGKVESSSLTNKFGIDENITISARNDIKNKYFLRESVEIIIKKYAPSYKFPLDWGFNIIELTDGFAVDSNLDFGEITKEFQIISKSKNVSVDPAFIINEIAQGSLDLRLSAKYASEYSTSSTRSLIAQSRLEKLISTCTNRTDDIHIFQSMVLGNSASVREAINSGTRTFDEFLDLLEGALKFKRWLGGINPDKGLLQQYNAEITSGNWLEKLAPKITRFAFFTGLGGLAEVIAPTGFGIPTGVAVGATDNFLVDKLLRGWSPSHFVSGKLKSFVDT